MTQGSTEPTVLHVGGAAPYDVVVGHDLAGLLPGILGQDVTRVALLFSDGIAELAQPVLDVLVEEYDVLALGLPDGEAAKTSSVANDCGQPICKTSRILHLPWPCSGPPVTCPATSSLKTH